MTANVLEHRRARAFADAVEDRPGTAVPIGAPHQEPAGEGQFTELLAAVDALGALPPPVLDPTVKTTQRALLMAEFERAFASGGVAVPGQRRGGAHRATEAARRFRPGTRWGRRLAYGGLAAGVAVGALGGVAAASSSALPGDSLYGMKRGLENWQLDFAGSDAARGRLLLDQASNRMSEAQQLMAHQSAGETLSPHLADEVSRALTDMNSEGSQGRELLKAVYRQDHTMAPLQQLASFADSQQQRLHAIEPRLDGQLAPYTGQVQSLLDGISRDIAPLQLLPSQGAGGTSTLPTGGTGAGATPSAGDSGSPGSSPAPSGATTSGTGTTTSGSSAAPKGSTTSGTGSSGGLVQNLTGGLLGGSTPSATPTAASSATSASSASASPAGNGVTVPPLIPGLLPSIGIGLTGG